MKKLYILSLLCLSTLSSLAAEKGDMSFGWNLGVAPCLEKHVDVTNFELGTRYRYNLTDNIRLGADMNYGFEANHVDVFTLSANFQYDFNISPKFTVYPLAGIGYGHIGGSFDSIDIDVDYELPGFDSGIDSGFEVDIDSSTGNRFLFNVGVGGNYSINDRMALYLEIKYQFMKDFSRLPISIGYSYYFN